MMPIVVDKEERRAEVEAVAFDIVAERGIGAVTTREVAKACGCSTSIVSHYFESKEELLFNIYRRANMLARERLLSIAGTDAPLVECFCQILPMDDLSRRMWQVWLAFWAQAHLDPRYAEERRRSAEDGLAVHRVVIASRYREPPTSAQLTLNARCLIAAVTGIAMEACFAPEDWTPARMRAVLAAQFKAIGLPEDA
ncbi:TetR/AcrR family transcriptional regulator [Croceicoccus gelatinilyticus]|uniref:TetR/AcrR family transcriptional regulator n=1 Tax=Croceicoccus gelatinilyticus TaxID=2835536 RepID=UPI001BCCD78E|nr:TetR/AcrR family transcriptional regulator [Croceicoccus gelatinilyticus]MBS7670527.1 TetR/AcrR family transcriptional regulator [Croceicoccus gelatinilyticus]